MRVAIHSTIWSAEELLEFYPCLKDYNFINIHPVSYQGPSIEINNLDNIFELMNKTDKPIIIIKTDEEYHGYPYNLEIYDGYRE